VTAPSSSPTWSTRVSIIRNGAVAATRDATLLPVRGAGLLPAAEIELLLSLLEAVLVLLDKLELLFSLLVVIFGEVPAGGVTADKVV
jgi:hypothetical protein